MTKIDLVIFDMAGTTVQDNHEVEQCFAKAAKETGLKVSDEQILAAQGWSKRFVFEKYWADQLGARDKDWEQQVEKSYNTFKNILEEHYRTHDIYPAEGTLEIFDYLKKNQIKIALTTGFYRKVADIILEQLGWLKGLDESYIGNEHSIIQMSITSDEVENGRPAPNMIVKAMNALKVTDPKRIIKIGDTPSDIQSARKANCLYALAVGNGTHTTAQLEPFAPDKILNSLQELPRFLESEALVPQVNIPPTI